MQLRDARKEEWSCLEMLLQVVLGKALVGSFVACDEAVVALDASEALLADPAPIFEQNPCA